MYSFGFPDMVSSLGAENCLLKDKEAVKSNISLLFDSEQLSLFGDPYYGSQLKKTLFEQADGIIVDLVIDEIYTMLVTFIPQIFVQRKDIEVFTDHTTIYAEVRYLYLLDNTADLYTIKLTSDDSF